MNICRYFLYVFGGVLGSGGHSLSNIKILARFFFVSTSENKHF